MVIRDAEGLREGETDRLSLVIQNLRQMGAKVGEMPDGLVVQGPVRLQGTEVDAGGDALTGLTFALAGLVAEGENSGVKYGAYVPRFRRGYLPVYILLFKPKEVKI